MDYSTQVSAMQPLSLDECCCVDLFEIIELDNSMSLPESGSRLRFVASRFNKGEDFIDYVISHIGQHAFSLKIDFWDFRLDLSEIICKINECLRNHSWSAKAAYTLDNVEQLTLSKCDSGFTKSFLENFNNLKYLNCFNCSIKQSELKIVFQNNPNIECFSSWNLSWNCRYGATFDCQLLEVVPGLERLRIVFYGAGIITELNSLLKLNQLKKLHLRCESMHLNSLLKELAKRGIMEEMILDGVKVDDQFFDILTSFDKLQLLVICMQPSDEQMKLKSSIEWPKQLKHLKLFGFNFDLAPNCFIGIIQQLKNIENLDVFLCSAAEEDKIYFENVAQLIPEILHIIEESNRKQRLNVVLPKFVESADEYHSKKYFIDSELLRILQQPDTPNELDIKIDFSAYDSW